MARKKTIKHKKKRGKKGKKKKLYGTGLIRTQAGQDALFRGLKKYRGKSDMDAGKIVQSVKNRFIERWGTKKLKY